MLPNFVPIITSSHFIKSNISGNSKLAEAWNSDWNAVLCWKKLKYIAAYCT